jgi:hypothetical protein
LKEGERRRKRGVNVEARSAGSAGKETYYQRWRRLHPKVSFYLKKEQYERLKEAAASKNMTVKDFVLSLIEGFEGRYEEARGRGFEEGYARAVEDFVDDPWLFREAVRRRHPKADVALFEVPCSICGKPMVFTHAERNWATEIKPELLGAFKHWYHVPCKERGA